MMKSAENWPRGEPTEPLNWPMRRRVLAQGLMRSEFVVIARVGRKDPAQMGLAQDDDVIKALPVLTENLIRAAMSSGSG